MIVSHHEADGISVVVLVFLKAALWACKSGPFVV